MTTLARAILFVKDLERMTAFYGDALGLALVPERSSEGWAELEAGGATLALHAIPPHIAKSIRIGTPPAPRSEAPTKLAFAVSDLDAARARLVALGAKMAEPSSWGSCDGVDLEGNVFQIVKS